jgi:hypothetical protein
MEHLCLRFRSKLTSFLISSSSSLLTLCSSTHLCMHALMCLGMRVLYLFLLVLFAEVVQLYIYVCMACMHVYMDAFHVFRHVYRDAFHVFRHVYRDAFHVFRHVYRDALLCLGVCMSISSSPLR